MGNVMPRMLPKLKKLSTLARPFECFSGSKTKTHIITYLGSAVAVGEILIAFLVDNYFWLGKLQTNIGDTVVLLVKVEYTILIADNVMLGSKVRSIFHIKIEVRGIQKIEYR